MEVYGIKPTDSGVVYSNSQTSGQSLETSPESRSDQGQVGEKSQPHKELSKEEANAAADEMNSIVQALNTDLQFKLHEKTKQLIVQVVDERNGKVLKEFPPHELLDVMAKIRDYVGALLDKKA